MKKICFVSYVIALVTLVKINAMAILAAMRTRLGFRIHKGGMVIDRIPIYRVPILLSSR